MPPARQATRRVCHELWLQPSAVGLEHLCEEPHLVHIGPNLLPLGAVGLEAKARLHRIEHVRSYTCDSLLHVAHHQKRLVEFPCYRLDVDVELAGLVYGHNLQHDGF
eukprot:scaffold47200_cov63-Phaeocystis_antarctica.AAC.2